MIEPYFLELHFSQLVGAWKKARYNSYSDAQKQDYHDKLQELYNALKKIHFDILPSAERLEYKEIIDFFIRSLDFLNNSTINSVPYELIECLKFAMSEWIDNSDEFIIVTSYNQYSFDPSLVMMLHVYSMIESRFKIKFNRKLVQINLPKYLEKDYLCNAVLYHELGHFVDQIHKVYTPIAVELWKNRNNPDCIKYFPYILGPLSYKNIEYLLIRHTREFFADIFACQYLGKASYYYLSYIAGDNSLSKTHPSTDVRIQLINEFLEGPPKHGFVLNTFIKETKKQANRDITIRGMDIVSDDILKLLPCIIEDSKQLHSLYSEGWEIWIHKCDLFQKENCMVNPLKPSQIYQIINNLIEKSINNFIVSEKWKENQKVLHV